MLLLVCADDLLCYSLYFMAWAPGARSFPFTLHGDEGSGHGGDPCLVLSWSPVWAARNFDVEAAEGGTSLLNKFPIVFIPKKFSTVPHVLASVFSICVELSGPLLLNVRQFSKCQARWYC